MVLGFLSGFRDWIIVIWGLLSIISLIFMILATWAIYRGVREILDTVKTMMDQDIRPMLTIGQDTASNVAGTTRFLGDTVARPVIKGLSFLTGARRALVVFAGLTGRGRRH